MTNAHKIISKIFIFAAGILCVGVIAHSAFAFGGKIDDWKFTPAPESSYYAPSGYYGPTMDSIFNISTLVQYWYVYLIVLFILGLYLWLLCIFLQGIWLFFRAAHDKDQRSKGTHKIAIGLPIFVFTITLIGGVLFVANGFDSDIANMVAFFLLIITVCFVVSLFLRGLYCSIKYRTKDHDRVKRGRVKVLFALLECVLLVVPFLFYFVMDQMTSAVMSSAPSGSYSGPYLSTQGSSAGGSVGQYFGAASTAAPSAMRDTSIGLSVGGAKDVNNFRENIKQGFLPLPTDVTYEGLFYDYTFDTGIQEPCQKLFCPSYASAVSKDPFSQKDEYFLSVGLNSGIQQKDFARKKMNVVVVLDISGSMGSQFDEYYYDRFGRKNTVPNEEDKKDAGKSKMKVASEAVATLVDHLKDDDSFGMVLFDDTSYLAKPLKKVVLTDISKIKGHIRELQEQGGTNMSAGIKEAATQFDTYADAKSAEYENRIIFLTDAMPNVGDTTDEDLFALGKNLADKKVYTTFIGVGVAL